MNQRPEELKPVIKGVACPDGKTHDFYDAVGGKSQWYGYIFTSNPQGSATPNEATYWPCVDTGKTEMKDGVPIICLAVFASTSQTNIIEYHIKRTRKQEYEMKKARY